MAHHYSLDDLVQFMQNYPIMSAAMIGEHGPVATVLLFTIDNDLTMYFSCHKDTYKAQALSQDPRMAFSIWGNSRIYIQGTGVVGEVIDEDSKVVLFKRLIQEGAKIKDFWPPILRINNESPFIMFKLKVNWLRAMDLSSNSSESPEKIFTEFTFN